MANVEDVLVLLLRSPSNPDCEDKYHKILASKGFSAVSSPVLSFEFHNIDKLAESLEHPDKHSGMILTSQRSVEALLIAVDRIGLSKWQDNLQKDWQNLHLFSVGDATFKSMKDSLGLLCSGQEAGSAENLVPMIIQAMKTKNKPLLFPCGNLTKETIPHELSKAELNLESIQVYRTCQHPDIKQSVFNIIQTKGCPSVVVFFSPSGLDYSLHILQEQFQDFPSIKLVAIGNTTYKAMIDKGLPIAGVSKKPNPDSLCQCIEDCFANQ